jgi:hypothetical protein
MYFIFNDLKNCNFKQQEDSSGSKPIWDMDRLDIF